MNIKAIIIDDEEKSRQSLRLLIEKYCEGVLIAYSISLLILLYSFSFLCGKITYLADSTVNTKYIQVYT